MQYREAPPSVCCVDGWGRIIFPEVLTFTVYDLPQKAHAQTEAIGEGCIGFHAVRFLNIALIVCKYLLIFCGKLFGKIALLFVYLISEGAIFWIFGANFFKWGNSSVIKIIKNGFHLCHILNT